MYEAISFPLLVWTSILPGPFNLHTIPSESPVDTQLFEALSMSYFMALGHDIKCPVSTITRSFSSRFIVVMDPALEINTVPLPLTFFKNIPWPENIPLFRPCRTTVDSTSPIHAKKTLSPRHISVSLTSIALIEPRNFGAKMTHSPSPLAVNNWYLEPSGSTSAFRFFLNLPSIVIFGDVATMQPGTAFTDWPLGIKIFSVPVVVSPPMIS